MMMMMMMFLLCFHVVDVDVHAHVHIHLVRNHNHRRLQQQALVEGCHDYETDQKTRTKLRTTLFWSSDKEETWMRF